MRPRRSIWPLPTTSNSTHVNVSQGIDRAHNLCQCATSGSCARRSHVETRCSALARFVPVRTITSDRLRLRPWRDDDADFLLDLESRWDVVRFLGARPTTMRTREDALASIARRRAVDDPIHGIWAITVAADGRLVGNLRLKPIPLSTCEPDNRPNDVEIGWHLHPDAWGQGYATEAAEAVLDDAFSRVWRRFSPSRIPTTMPPRPSAGGSA